MVSFQTTLRFPITIIFGSHVTKVQDSNIFFRHVTKCSSNKVLPAYRWIFWLDFFRPITQVSDYSDGFSHITKIPDYNFISKMSLKFSITMFFFLKHDTKKISWDALTCVHLEIKLSRILRDYFQDRESILFKYFLYNHLTLF